MAHYYIALKVQGLYFMTASDFRFRVTGFAFCFQVCISGPEPMNRVPTCIRKPQTNTSDESIKSLEWLFLVVLDDFRLF